MLGPMRLSRAILLLTLAASLTGRGESLPPPPGPVDASTLYPVTPPSDGLRQYLHLADFYQKHVDAEGLPVVSSERVSDYALKEAAYLIDRMLDGREDIRRALIRNRVRFTVMAHDEYTTMVPEYSDLQPRLYWNKRARGLGATPERPAVSCGEENLLGLEGDPYAAENILVHEFAHAIHEMGLNTIDPTFDRRLESTFQTAVHAGLWTEKYAATNRREYWAEGVQSWFDTNRENDHEHNFVNTREELIRYDPGLAGLVREVFGENAWRYRRPADRAPQGRRHLAGFDVKSAPRFSWPAPLTKWYDAYESGKELPTSETGEAWTNLEVRKVATVGLVRSSNSTTESSVMFLNRTPDTLKVFWITPTGERRFYGKIPPGLRFLTTSYAGHVWLLASDKDEPRALVEATDKPGRAVFAY